jgi:putative ABC transport system permease protein
MNILQILRTALRALTVNKMRSILTMLGVIIGVTSVVSLMSIGYGVQSSITSSFESMGTDLLYVRGGASMTAGVMGAMGSASTLTLDDAEALLDSDLAPAVKAVAPQVQTNAQVVAGDQNTNTQILGVTEAYESVRNYQVANGEFISDSNVESKSLVVVLGSDTAATLFPDEEAVDQKIKINSIQFTVIGVLASKGSTGMGSQDDVIIAPITTVMSRLSSSRTASGGQTVQTINVQVTSTDQTDAAIAQITSILEERHDIDIEAGDTDDFTITSQQETIDSLKASTQVLVLFLGAIAGITLLVGGIGIMNIMLVSVTERTREIGIRKALGAKKRDILLQFLIEATLLSLTGGVIGVLIGWIMSLAISGMSMSGTTITTTMTATIPILAVSVSLGTGILFGLYPAYRAARLNPIEALRYEI